MINKQFVSLVFFSNKVQVLKLNTKGDKAQKFGSFPIPQGVINNYEIIKPDVLIQILQNAWKTLKIREKFVGIVVPEFSTYTKSLSLPQLSDRELAEAIAWQSSEFLPTNPAEMVMDWKIISKDDKNYKILTVAILRNILSGYVGVAGKAGLFPVVVETPSLSLNRISGGGFDETLVVYVNQDETILVLNKGGSIAGSSVVKTRSSGDIIRTAIRIIKHYDGEGVKRVYLGGYGLSNEFITALGKGVGVAPKIIPMNITGMTAAQVHEYLIAISLQFKDPAQPESSETVNLLPSSWVRHYDNKSLDVRLWATTLTISIVVLGTFLGSFMSYSFHSAQVRGLSDEQIQSRTEDEEVSAKIAEINELSQSIIAVSDVIESPQKVINKLESAKVDGVTIKDYEINFENGGINVMGIARDRNVMSNYKKALDSVEGFNDVVLPITSFAQESDINFVVTLNYKTKKTSTPPKLNI